MSSLVNSRGWISSPRLCRAKAILRREVVTHCLNCGDSYTAMPAATRTETVIMIPAGVSIGLIRVRMIRKVKNQESRSLYLLQAVLA
jgi:hypothetical protein